MFSSQIENDYYKFLDKNDARPILGFSERVL